VNDLDHLLSGRETLCNLGATGALLDARDEVFYYANIYVRLKESKANLACYFIYVCIAKTAATAHSGEDRIKSARE
jgi:hypothetical protein